MALWCLWERSTGTVCKKLIHNRYSGVRGDLSQVAAVSGVDDVMGQFRKLI